MITYTTHTMNMHQQDSERSSHAVPADGQNASSQEEEVEKNSAEGEEPTCVRHKGEVMRLYCETCLELICRDCTVADHCEPRHHYIHLRSVVESLKSKLSLKDQLPFFYKDIEDLEQSLAASTSARQEFAKNITRTGEQVRERAAQIRAKVTAQENDLLNEIKHLEQHRMQTFDAYEETVSAALQRKQRSLERMAKDAANATPDADGGFLAALYSTIGKDVQLLRSPNPPAIDSKFFCNLRFGHWQKVSDIRIGKVEIEAKWEMSCEFGKDGRGPGKFSSFRSLAAAKPGEIAVADYNGSSVLIFSTDGHRKREIFTKHEWSAPYSLAAVRERLVIIDNTKYVKVLNKDNELDFAFPALLPSEMDTAVTNIQCVAVKKDGTIVVGDTNRKVLTEHDHRNGSLKRTIRVNTEPYFLAVDSRNDRVLISGITHVDVVDSNGATLFTFKPIINGRPARNCRGLCHDNSGVYIAADNEYGGSGHIHHYDSTGQFLSCVAQGLYGPRGLTFTTDGQLAVADVYSVKMYHKV